MEFLEDGVSMVNDGSSAKTAKKAKLESVERNPLPGDIKKEPTASESLSSDKDEKKQEKTAVDTEYIIQGDGQFSIDVMSPAKRDKVLAKRAKEAKQKAKLEKKLDRDASNTVKASDDKGSSVNSSGTNNSSSNDSSENDANNKASGSHVS